ncbi:MAG: ParB N-terminal domain-containing protein [Pseudomonadota bacterium]
MKHTPIKTDAPIVFVKIKDMQIDELNPRSQRSDASINEMKQSIIQIGLAQPPAGIQRDGFVGIVAGGTRALALQAALEDGSLNYDTVPVLMAKNEEQALSWAVAENVVRKGLSPYDQLVAYGALYKAGHDIADIAKAHGTTEFNVKRRLKLAQLPKVVLDALGADKINLDQAVAFTYAPNAKEAKAVLKDLLDEKKYNIRNAHDVQSHFQKRPLTSSSRIVRFVGHKMYIEAGGKLVGDLFASDDCETLIYTDRKLLEKLFDEKFASEVERIKAMGFAFVHVSDQPHFDLYYLNAKYERIDLPPSKLNKKDQARYNDLAELCTQDEAPSEEAMAELAALENKLAPKLTDQMREVVGVGAYVDNQGNLCTSKAFVRVQDFAKARKLGVIETKSPSGKPVTDATYSGALRADFETIKSLALQTALLDQSKILDDLLAYSFSVHTSNSFNAFAITTSPNAIAPKTDADIKVDNRLNTVNYARGWNEKPVADPKKQMTFARFRKLSPKKKEALRTAALARLINRTYSNDAVLDEVTKLAKPKLREVWTPDVDGFFKRIKAAQLDKIHEELLGTQSTEFIKMKKAQKALELAKLFKDADTRAALNQKVLARIDNWVPDM